MDYLVIHLRFVPEEKPPPAFPPSIFERAIQWSALRWHAQAGITACADIQAYLFSYRAEGMGTTKHTFLKRWFALNEVMEEIYGMPKNSSKPITNGGGGLTFINLRLTEEQLTEVDGMKASPSQLVTMLYSAVQEGLAFSFSYNAEKHQANAMLIDRREGSPTQLHAVSAFSDDCSDALKLLMYKHFNLMAGDWLPYAGAAPDKRKRG